MTAPRQVPRPEHVFVGTKTYEIAWLDESEWTMQNLREEDAGNTVGSRGRIFMRVMPDVMETSLQEVLLHEITHAVWHESYLTYLKASDIDDPEEGIIGVQTHGLLFVLQQNPDVVAYLTSNGAMRR